LAEYEYRLAEYEYRLAEYEYRLAEYEYRLAEYEYERPSQLEDKFTTSATDGKLLITKTQSSGEQKTPSSEPTWSLLRRKHHG